MQLQSAHFQYWLNISITPFSKQTACDLLDDNDTHTDKQKKVFKKKKILIKKDAQEFL